VPIYPTHVFQRRARRGAKVQAFVLKVSSLERAETFLRESDMLGVVTDNQINIAPERIEGLDVRLVG
jgi:hypothetical protein